MIYSTANNRLISANFALRSAAVELLTIKIDCLTGYSLSLVSGADADLTIEAKNSGVAAAVYTNIGTTPIDLSVWNGTRQTFIVRLTPQTAAAASRKIVSFRVGR